MKKGFVIIIFFIVLFVMGWFASPYWMLYQIRQAIEQNQAEQISKYIDYPRVQASLEPQIQEKINKSIGLENNHIWIGHWGKHFTEQLSHQVVQTLLTPEAIALLLQGNTLKKSLHFPQIPPKNLLSQTVFSQKYGMTQVIETEFMSLPQTVKKNEQDARYTSLNTFHVTVATFASKDTRFIFQRHYVDWKLTAIHFN